MPRPPHAGKGRKAKDSGDHRGEAKSTVAGLAVAVDREPPRPPPILKGNRAGHNRFKAIYAAAPWLGPTDSTLVAQLVVLEGLQGEITATLAGATPLFTTSPAGRRFVAPELRAMLEISAEVRSISASLGLAAADRARLGLEEAKAATLLETIKARRLAQEASTVNL